MGYWIDIANVILIFSIFAVSLNLLIGYTGQLSVAHAAFGAIGGYFCAYMTTTFGWSFWPCIAGGTLMAGLAGLVMAFPALRLSDEYLVLLTIAFSSIVLAVVGAVPQLGGAYGLIAPAPANLAPLPGGDLLFPAQWFLPLLGFAAFAFGICYRLGESPFGRVLRGIRDEPTAIRALGYDVFAYKLAVFGITSALGGLAGALLYYYNQIVSPGVYGLDVSLKIFAMTILGGLGNLFGSVLGAALIQLLQPLLERAIRLDPGHAFLVQAIIYGVGLVLLVRLRPQGLLREGAFRSQPKTDGAGPQTQQIVSPATVDVACMSKRFGGIVASDDLSFRLEPGTITALIGPNGAGKTTVFNLLTGAIYPDCGAVTVNGTDISHTTPDKVARTGMVRSFQDVRLFGQMSALENVLLAGREPKAGLTGWPSGAAGGSNLWDLFLRPRISRDIDRAARRRAMGILDTVGLSDEAHLSAETLSFGQQKMLSFARLLATGAPVLLLDEPASGVDGEWVDRILDVVIDMRAAGHTVCIVEHSLHVVERLADHVIFMELGKITAQGEIAELTRDERLAEVYFGTV